MTNLKSRSARSKLAPRSSAHTQNLSTGRALGYRKRRADQPGRWLLRIAKPEGGYSFDVLGVADDLADADGKGVLNYAQALKVALDQTSADPAKISVTAALDQWADWKAGSEANPKRIPAFFATAKRIGREFPKTTLASITVPQIDLWMAADTREGRATKNRLMATLKAALNRAADRHGYEGTRAWKRAKAHPSAEAFGKRMVVLTEDQESALIAASPPDLARLLTGLQMTGARYGEIITATVGDLYGDRLTLSGKTGPRTISLSPDKVEWFRMVAGNRPPEARLFIRDATGGPWLDTTVFRPLQRAAAVAGDLPEDTTSYAFRHGFISRALAKGVPTVAVAQHCGTSVRMIERTYAKFTSDELAGWFA